jgi:arabinoxylan arabinofuranohydrolase
MQKAVSLLLPFLYLISVFFAGSFADNPVIQTCYTADPAPLVYDSTVYLYVGHDSANAPDDSYLMRAWKCYSSKDMVNWTDHGVVLQTKEISWSGGDADAAEVDYRNGKFYYYISTQGPGGISIGVAVSDTPLGPFTDIGKPLISGSQMTGCNATHSWRGLDPTVLIDEDGQAYLYTGNNVLYWVRLNTDMISWSGTLSCLPQTNAASFGPDYEEAPWVYRRNDLYYLVYASEFPECIRYCTSANPLGPWTYRGQIMAKQPNGVSNTIHPGVCDFGGNSYLFYHNAGLKNGGSYRRSVCVEQFTYNNDGTIPEIPETKEGVSIGVGNLNPYDTTEAETICWEEGIETEICTEGGMNVTAISNGDYIKVEGVDFGDGAESFEARVASGGSGGTIELRLDKKDGESVGTCTVVGIDGTQSWETRTCDISGAEGIHDLYFVFTGGSGELFNFNWWKFEPLSVEARRSQTTLTPAARIAVQTGNRLQCWIHFPPGSTREVNATLFDLNGRIIGNVFSGNVSSHRFPFSLDLYNKRPGMYLLNVTSCGARLLNKKIMIN